MAFGYFDETNFTKCIKISLDRQVGNRYFVTASNAGKILFLREAAIGFLQNTDKYKGNQLERNVYEKLQSIDCAYNLKADALMFYYVYADLVMLVKSQELQKSAFDMNKHYQELSLFLEAVGKCPQMLMDKTIKVFPSKMQLYGNDKKSTIVSIQVVNFRRMPLC